MIASRRSRSLWAPTLGLLLIFSSGCTDEGGTPVEVDPCEGACPAEECIAGQCVDNDGGVEPDGEDTSEPEMMPDADAGEPDAPPVLCDEDGECAEGEICDEGLNPPECREGCRGDADCGNGEICDQVSKTCGIGCADDGDCPEGQSCEDGLCVEVGCQADDECAPDEYCFLGTRTCEEGCRLGECPSGQLCDEETRVCVEGCFEDTDCPDGQVCVTIDDEEGPRQLCVGLPCEDDLECLADEFCGLDEDAGRNACLLGCRLDPDNCNVGLECDPETRRCQGDRCDRDGDCDPGQICEGEICVEGCRDDGDCGEGDICDPEANLCVPDTCSRDQDCERDEFCALDVQPNRCQTGCREGGCPMGQLCALDTRECTDGCNADTDCPDGEYCEGENDQCEVGCRGDRDCRGDEVCDRVLVGDDLRNRCTVPSCQGDGDCANDEYCGFDPESQRDICFVGCRVDPDNCPNGETCNGVTHFCEAEGCIEDSDCVEGRLCLNELCTAGCREDSDCADGRACNLAEGLCECFQQEECANGLICDGGLCENGCTNDLDCEIDQVCNQDTGFCQLGCRSDDECLEGEYCDPDFDDCFPGCRTDEDCEGDFVCDILVVDDLRFQQCLPPPCESDNECFPEEYCGFDEFLGRVGCVFGCRTDPDNCTQGATCNPVDRNCAFETCANDNECDQGEICFDDGLDTFCRAGCRNDNQCADLEFCVDFTQRCTCFDDNSCFNGQVCQVGECDAPCGSDFDCAFNGFVCEIETGRCLQGCQQNQDCDEDFGEECDRDRGICVPSQCQNDEVCAPFQFCDEDLDPPRCNTGCREHECGDSQHCDLGTRTCEAGCVDHEDCPGDQFCDSLDDTCRFGCRDNNQCPDGQNCEVTEIEGERQAICQAVRCNADGDCAAHEYCGPDLFENFDVCQIGCRPNADICPDRLQCDPSTRVCVTLPCNEDGDCVDGEICRAGVFGNFCDVGCRGNGDCGGGQCNQEFESCECAVPDDCPFNRHGCEEGFCILGCQDNDDCFFPATCDLNTRLCVTDF